MDNLVSLTIILVAVSIFLESEKIDAIRQKNMIRGSFRSLFEGIISMSTLLEKQIKVNRIVTTSIEHARAIEDPARAKIVELLYRQALSADQICTALKKFGIKKALTTIRHHLDILKVSGLIEIARIEESRGAITKFYSTSTKLLDFQTPDDFDSKYSKIIVNTSEKIEKILKGLAPKTSKLKGKKSEGYSQYLVMEIMNRAMTNIFENDKK